MFISAFEHYDKKVSSEKIIKLYNGIPEAIPVSTRPMYNIMTVFAENITVQPVIRSKNAN